MFEALCVTGFIILSLVCWLLSELLGEATRSGRLGRTYRGSYEDGYENALNESGEILAPLDPIRTDKQQRNPGLKSPETGHWPSNGITSSDNCPASAVV